MTTNKRKKVSRLRGSHTHKWGAKKKHRGAGHRGGRGNSSTGKRSDARLPSVWGDTNYFGKHGFKSGEKIDIISIRDLEELAPRLIAEKIAVEDKGILKIDLSKIGCEKLLSNGYAERKWEIKVTAASAAAIEKIKEAGGSVVVG